MWISRWFMRHWRHKWDIITWFSNTCHLYFLKWPRNSLVTHGREVLMSNQNVDEERQLVGLSNHVRCKVFLKIFTHWLIFQGNAREKNVRHPVPRNLATPMTRPKLHFCAHWWWVEDLGLSASSSRNRVGHKAQVLSKKSSRSEASPSHLPLSPSSPPLPSLFLSSTFPI